MEKRKRATEGMSYVSGPSQPHYPPSASIEAGPTPNVAHATSERGGFGWKDPTHLRAAAVGHDDKTGPQAWCGAPLVPQIPPGAKKEEDDEDAEKNRLAGMEMVHKAASGVAVLSGPEDLGLQQDGRSTQSPESQVSTQFQRSGQDKSSSPTPDRQVL